MIAILILAALLAGCMRQPKASCTKLPPEKIPNYAALYQGVLESLKDADDLGARRNFHAAVIAARLYAVTKNQSYGQDAVIFFRCGLAAITAQETGSNPLDDFHAHRSFGLACLEMQRLGLLADADREALRPVVTFWLEEFVRSFEPGTRNQRTLFRLIETGVYVDHNIRLANMVCGAALSAYLKLTDDAPGTAPLRQKVDAHVDDYWNRLMQTGDLDEDASNYTALGQSFLLDLAQVLDRTDALAASKDFRRMFTRRRDVVSPAGIIPEYGDSYFNYNSGALDTCYVLESAAKLYNDPSLLVPARQHYRTAMAADMGVRAEDNWYRGFGLINLATLPCQPVFPDTPPSRVTRRNRYTNNGIERDLADKLMLKTGRTPGSAMIMMDLYASGSHAHLEKGPSIAYYEAAGVPLFHNMGRHGTRSATTGNIFWAMPEYAAFPGVWEEDEWFTMAIPLNYLPKVGANEYRIGRDIMFRNFQEHNRQVKYLYLDNVRLEGPAGTLLIDDFEDASTWHRNVYGVSGVELEQSEDATQGQYSQRVNWSILPSGFCTRLFKNRQNFNFSGNDYRMFKVDVKYSGQRPYMHIRSVVETQIDLADQSLPNTIAAAHTEQRGDDAYGEVAYSRYTVGNARLTRRMVLTREGCLVIQDTCTPSPEMIDWIGGQLWQIYEMAEQGKDWFASAVMGDYPTATDGQRRMLVKYHTDNDTEAFVKKIVQNYYQPNPKGRKGTEYFTTGTRRRMTGTKPQTFVMVVVPHKPAAEAATLANGIIFSSPEAGVAIVTIPASIGNDSPLQISIGPDAWDVRR